MGGKGNKEQGSNIVGVMTLEEIATTEKILGAMHECENGVRWKASVQHFEMDSLRWAASIRNSLLDGSYRARGFCHFDITERGKLRHIQAEHISDRTVQKLFCKYALRDQIYPRLIYDNSASQQGKGTEFALKRLKEHLRWHYARHGKRGAVLVMDYHNYFDSIPHDKVIAALTQGQEDERIRRYLADFVNAFAGDHGLGLGSETSQVGAICYPTPIDKLVKERLRVHCYARYMDDSYLIHPDRDYVVFCKEQIREKAKELGICLNERKTKIHNLASDDFVFLKKRVRLTETGKVILRPTRENIRAEEKRIRQYREEVEAGRMPLSSARQSYRAWRSYAKKCNAYETVGRMDRFFVKTMGTGWKDTDCRAGERIAPAGQTPRRPAGWFGMTGPHPPQAVPLPPEGEGKGRGAHPKGRITVKDEEIAGLTGPEILELIRRLTDEMETRLMERAE